MHSLAAWFVVAVLRYLWMMQKVLCRWELQWKWRDRQYRIMNLLPVGLLGIPTKCEGECLSLCHISNNSQGQKSEEVHLWIRSGVLYHRVFILYAFPWVETFKDPLWMYKWMRSQLASPSSVPSAFSQNVVGRLGAEWFKHCGSVSCWSLLYWTDSPNSVGVAYMTRRERNLC